MHVTILGAGALGRVYGLKLRAHGAQVVFVVRPGREADESPFIIEQVNGAKRRDELDRPKLVASVPPHTDFVLVSVRSDQLDGIAPLVAAAPKAVVVVLTPMIPEPPPALERRLVAGMPGVVGYLDEREVVRYWTTSVASTLLDEGGDEIQRGAVEELARRLTKCGLNTRLAKDVWRESRATTIAFFPLIAAIDVGRGVDGALADKELLAVVLDASKECDALARKVGPVASWAGLLTRFVGPFTLKPGVALAKRVAPEPTRFVEVHFGEKLHAQHVAMGDAILKLADAPMPGLEELMNRVRARG